MSALFPDDLLDRLRRCKVVAGFSVGHASEAAPVAQALLDGGVGAVELTLRTDAALDAVGEVAKHVPGIALGVGTILTPEQLVAVNKAGALFGVAPGTNPRVITAAKDAGFPFAPGVATPSDLEAAIELGCRFVKFFPAEPCGGVRYLKSMSAPYAHLGVTYFPLGGVNADNMHAYLERPDVVAVGGSWIVSGELVKRRDWAGIKARAADVTRALAAT